MALKAAYTSCTSSSLTTCSGFLDMTSDVFLQRPSLPEHHTYCDCDTTSEMLATTCILSSGTEPSTVPGTYLKRSVRPLNTDYGDLESHLDTTQARIHHHHPFHSQPSRSEQEVCGGIRNVARRFRAGGRYAQVCELVLWSHACRLHAWFA